MVVLIVFIAFCRIVDFRKVNLWNLWICEGMGSGCPLESLRAGVDLAVDRSFLADSRDALKMVLVQVVHIAWLLSGA